MGICFFGRCMWGVFSPCALRDRVLVAWLDPSRPRQGWFIPDALRGKSAFPAQRLFHSPTAVICRRQSGGHRHDPRRLLWVLSPCQFTRNQGDLINRYVLLFCFVAYFPVVRCYPPLITLTTRKTRQVIRCPKIWRLTGLRLPVIASGLTLSTSRSEATLGYPSFIIRSLVGSWICKSRLQVNSSDITFRATSRTHWMMWPIKVSKKGWRTRPGCSGIKTWWSVPTMTFLSTVTAPMKMTVSSSNIILRCR